MAGGSAGRREGIKPGGRQLMDRSLAAVRRLLEGVRMWEMSGLLLWGMICLTGNVCNTEPDQRPRAGENGKGKDDGR